MARHARTPLRVLYDLLCEQGYVDTQVQFADLLRISRSNIASYLAGPAAKYRISPRLDSLHCWAWGRLAPDRPGDRPVGGPERRSPLGGRRMECQGQADRTYPAGNVIPRA